MFVLSARLFVCLLVCYRLGLIVILVCRDDLSGRFEVASTDLTELENKKKGLNNAIDALMDEVR